MRQQIHQLLTLLLQAGFLSITIMGFILLVMCVFQFFRWRKHNRLQREKDLVKDILYR